jgi:hypothetical protein
MSFKNSGFSPCCTNRADPAPFENFCDRESKLTFKWRILTIFTLEKMKNITPAPAVLIVSWGATPFITAHPRLLPKVFFSISTPCLEFFLGSSLELMYYHWITFTIYRKLCSWVCRWANISIPFYWYVWLWWFYPMFFQ